MSNHLKRRYSIGENNQIKKRTKVLSDIPSPETYDYADSYTLPIINNNHINNNITTHLPPSPPVINDPSTPINIPSTSIDTIPILKSFIISTRQQDPTVTTSNYTDINNILYQLHIERYSGNSSSISNISIDTDIDMMSDGTYQYDTVNALLKQAFLERHSPE